MPGVWSNFAVCHPFGTFGVSQANPDQPVKALENKSQLAFTQSDEEPKIWEISRQDVP
jgi:hypothetical protein